MSDEQQQAAIGRTIEEYVASKKKLATLQGEVGRQAASLAQISQTLVYLSGNASAASYVVGLAQQTAVFPTAAMLQTMAQDIQIEQDRRHSLYMQLKNLGFEPRD